MTLRERAYQLATILALEPAEPDATSLIADLTDLLAIVVRDADDDQELVERWRLAYSALGIPCREDMVRLQEGRQS